MVRGISHREKKYVEVIARHDCDGNVIPVSIVWEDRPNIEIEKILDRRQAASLKVGGNGIRFRIRTEHTETFLFYENPRWFVEAIVRET